MAKRKRRQILRRGGQILLEEWAKDENGKTYKGKDKAWVMDVRYRGWHIGGGGDDKLEACNGIIFGMKVADEEPLESEE